MMKHWTDLLTYCNPFSLCFYSILNWAKYKLYSLRFNPYSAETDFRRQNLTSTHVRF